MTTTSTSRRSSSSSPGGSPGSGPRVDVAGVHVVASVVADGDFHPGVVPAPELRRRQRALVDLPWTMLDQRHGVTAVDVLVPGGSDAEPGDVAVTGRRDAVLGCWVGDCAPVVVVGPTRLAIAHAGWRGLAAGVLAVAADALDEPIAAAVLGPTIGPCCYEFGAADLVAVAEGLALDPARVLGTTRWGAPALDVPAAVGHWFAGRGVTPTTVGSCPGCSYPGFSHRVRSERARHVVAAWRPGR